MLRDFDRFHAGAEAHCSVGLSNTAGHTAGDTRDEVAGAKGATVVLGF